MSVRALRPQRTGTVSHVSKLTAAKQKCAAGGETADDMERVKRSLEMKAQYIMLFFKYKLLTTLRLLVYPADCNLSIQNLHSKSSKLNGILYVTLDHKTVLSSTGIFVAIANNKLYGSKL